jgi:DNA-binding PadR family transcriptional regulator
MRLASLRRFPSGDFAPLARTWTVVYFLRMKPPSDLELALLSLAVRESTGRELAQNFAKSHGRALSYGSLYTTLRRMVEAGWLNQREDDDEDGRLRWYSLTAQGRRAHQQGVDHRLRAVRLAGAPRGGLV